MIYNFGYRFELSIHVQTGAGSYSSLLSYPNVLNP
jgi:hypothetical protein